MELIRGTRSRPRAWPLTDSDHVPLATKVQGASVLGNHAQAAVHTERLLIVAHELPNVVGSRTLLARTAAKAKDVSRRETLNAVADRGYYSGAQYLRPRTSASSHPCRSREHRVLGQQASSTSETSTICLVSPH